ncbi:adenosylcobalamin-dependent ribonucleoside-diphosphate reductase [Candidatus Woesearchaeota archaeon]|nr:adenosylcobalamin-dependent ribonucleoside-diphosphate reductase [Candidatus Woesearchaeota archaeon]
MQIKRRFTEKGDPLKGIEYENRTSVIKNPDGTIVFEIKDVEVPKDWSQVATDIIAQKYFRKTGVPQEDGTLGPERSVKQVAARLAGCWRHWGEKYNYFASKEDAQTFEDEMQHIIVNQMGAPNSPQWFNTGLFHSYGIKGQAQGHWYIDSETGEAKQSEDAYTRPQPHACAEYHTQVYTEEGTRYIGELVDNDLTGLKVFDGTGWVNVLATKDNGIRKTFRITLKNGNYIDLTEDHLVLQSPKRRKDGGTYTWGCVKDLEMGFRLQQPLLLEVKESNVFEEDLAKARLAGWIVGDGSVGTYSNVKRLEIITTNSEEHTSVLEDIKTVFGEEVSYWTTEFETKDEKCEGRRIHLSGKKIHSFVEKYDLEERSLTVKVPQKIVTASAQEKREFLKALFQADGCVRIRKDASRNSGDICLTTISSHLSTGVLQLLNSLGIYSRISQYKDKRENRHNPNHIIVAYGSAREQFQEQIGFISAEKEQKLILLNKLIQKSKTLPLIREESITSIEYIGEKHVYDIQTESGKFLGNGIVIHNCFIQSVNDDLVNEGGIFDLITREARIFKYGSGTGTNFSTLRGAGESLSGGGRSSGLMSFLKINDRAAGAIKSGGTTRRAAKMVSLDLDHPEIVEFVEWKMKEEQKVANLVAGSKSLYNGLNGILAAVKSSGATSINDKEIRTAVKRAISMNVPLNYVSRVLQLAEMGITEMNIPVLDTHFEGDAYNTVSGQNSNNSIRIPNKFFDVLSKEKDWELINRTDGKVHSTIPSKELWDRVCYSAWASADPGVQFDTTINEWHTCPEDGRINGSNPCSEYMFLDDTACNLASINLGKFLNEDNTFDIEGYKHAVRLWTIVLEISVLMAQFPSKVMAELSDKFRTLGLGYANLGTVLMRLGIPYDSEKGRSIAGALTAVMCGESYATSAELASNLGSFPGYKNNKEHMLKVIRNHRRAAYNAHKKDYESLTITPQGISKDCPTELLTAAKGAWDKALKLGEEHGFRNAQVTVIAPTGTIGLVMDCDTTGVEPDFALVKFKKLAGGGYMKIVNQSVPRALKTLGYTEEQITDIVKYTVGHGTLTGCPGINPQSLREKGFTQEEIDNVESSLESAMDLSFAFNTFTLGKDTLIRLGFTDEQLNYPGLDILQELGYTAEEVHKATDYICGAMTIEGAPHLKEGHLPVFDCASKCGKYGTRLLKYEAHINMMAAVQPFISGAISKTINMAREATIEDISDAYTLSWKLMVKANALYRDGCKLSQPLNSTSSDIDAELLQLEMEDDIDENITPEVVQKIMAKAMPSRRGGFSQEAHVGGHKVVVSTGEFDDGSLGELAVEMYKEGSTYRCLMNAFAKSVTKGLQHGVPLSEYVDEFTFTKFEPAGMVMGDPKIKQATSVVDYIFRVLGSEYLERDDLVHIKEAPARKTHQTVLAETSGKAIQEAKDQGFTGEECSECGSLKMKQNGTCNLCLDCGSTTGCS